MQQMLLLDSQNSFTIFFKQISKVSKKADYISFYNDVKKQAENERATNKIRVIENDNDYR